MLSVVVCLVSRHHSDSHAHNWDCKSLLPNLYIFQWREIIHLGRILAGLNFWPFFVISYTFHELEHWVHQAVHWSSTRFYIRCCRFLCGISGFQLRDSSFARTLKCYCGCWLETLFFTYEVSAEMSCKQWRAEGAWKCWKRSVADSFRIM